MSVKRASTVNLQTRIHRSVGALLKRFVSDTHEAVNFDSARSLVFSEKQNTSFILLLVIKYLLLLPFLIVSFFALVNQLIDQKCGGKVAVVEILMNSLLSRLVDSSHVVRKFCIRGLGNIASVEDSQVV